MSVAPNMNSKIDIPLSDRGPVRIVPDEWPVISEAFHDTEGPATICVRRRVDGRVLVHGKRVLLATGRIKTAGFLLERANNWSEGRVSSAEIVRAVRRVVGILGNDCGSMIDEIVGRLPPEEL